MKTISGVNVCRLKESFWQKFCLGAHAILLNEKESQTNIEKFDGVVMVLMIVLVKSVKFGKIRNRERKINKNI